MKISQYSKIYLLYPEKERVCRRCSRIDGAELKGLKHMGDFYVVHSQKAKSIDGRDAWKVIWRCRACGKFSHPHYTKLVDFSQGKGVGDETPELDPQQVLEAEIERARKIDERIKKGENVFG